MPAHPPVTLAIDTAQPRLQLGLLRADGAFESHVEEIASGHAERIFPAIAALLARAGLGYADLERIAVTTGPGSFTGLRIGLAAARGIALARGLPVVGVPSLVAISLSAPEDAGDVFGVLVDARRGEAYAQGFSAPGEPFGPVRLLAIEEARTKLPGALRLETPFPDIARLTRFAAVADPAVFPPEPSYVREADAKPQSDKRIARR